MAQRNTWQRERVKGALGEVDGFVSAQALHARLREAETGIGLATVYRALAALAEDGSADILHSPEGEAIYRACESRSHHHHLICRSCGATVEIAATPVEQWAREVAVQNGYTEPEHIVDIYGYCASCSARRTADAGARDESRAG